MFNGINLAFYNALQWIYSWVGNYGWSVVVFTLLIRLILLPLDVKSRKSMRSMNKVQPKLAALQQKYGNDREKLNQKTMELYKKEGVSPTSGCLPMLLQWPILIFMFTAMRVAASTHTVEMLEHIMNTGEMPIMQGWLWIKNVFQPDSFMASILPAHGSTLAAVTPVAYSSVLTPERISAVKEFLSSDQYLAFLQNSGLTGAFTNLQLNFVLFAPMLTIPTSLANLLNYSNGLFILPLLAACSQFFMTKIMSGTQKKKEDVPAVQQSNDAANAMNNGFMKWFFPIFSLWICATNNSAFSIYWMAVNIISIVETVLINRYLDHKEAAQALNGTLD